MKDFFDIFNVIFFVWCSSLGIIILIVLGFQLFKMLIKEENRKLNEKK